MEENWSTRPTINPQKTEKEITLKLVIYHVAVAWSWTYSTQNLAQEIENYDDEQQHHCDLIIGMWIKPTLIGISIIELKSSLRRSS